MPFDVTKAIFSISVEDIHFNPITGTISIPISPQYKSVQMEVAAIFRDIIPGANIAIAEGENIILGIRNISSKLTLAMTRALSDIKNKIEMTRNYVNQVALIPLDTVMPVYIEDKKLWGFTIILSVSMHEALIKQLQLKESRALLSVDGETLFVFSESADDINNLSDSVATMIINYLNLTLNGASITSIGHDHHAATEEDPIENVVAEQNESAEMVISPPPEMTTRTSSQSKAYSTLWALENSQLQRLRTSLVKIDHFIKESLFYYESNRIIFAGAEMSAELKRTIQSTIDLVFEEFDQGKNRAVRYVLTQPAIKKFLYDNENINWFRNYLTFLLFTHFLKELTGVSTDKIVFIVNEDHTRRQIRFQYKGNVYNEFFNLMKPDFSPINMGDNYIRLTLPDNFFSHFMAVMDQLFLKFKNIDTDVIKKMLGSGATYVPTVEGQNKNIPWFQHSKTLPIAVSSHPAALLFPSKKIKRSNVKKINWPKRLETVGITNKNKETQVPADIKKHYFGKM